MGMGHGSRPPGLGPCQRLGEGPGLGRGSGPLGLGHGPEPVGKGHGSCV